MALTTSELTSLKMELGYNLFDVGAEVYVGVVAFFEQVVAKFLLAGAVTTCSTVVPTPTPLPQPTQVTVTDPTGLTVNQVVQVDVDGRAETATISNVSGSVITVSLMLPHTGTYPVINTTTGLITSSSTVVDAVPSLPTLSTLTLLSGVGFNSFDRVVIDSNARQEITTVQSVSSNVITCLLTKGHVGTYEVTVEGGESIVRGLLQKLRNFAGMGGDEGGSGGDVLTSALAGAGIKKVDEIEFFGGSGTNGPSLSGNALQQALAMREYWRDELAFVLGCPRLNARNRGGSSMSMY